MNLSKICRDAAKVLKQNEWTKFANSRDKYGEVTATSDPASCQFCMLGALCRAMDKAGIKDYVLQMPALYEAFHGVVKTDDSLTYFNDMVCKEKQQVIDTLLLMADYRQ